MNPDYSHKVANKIEALCKQGCSHVNQILAKAKSGNEIEELSDFDRSEIEQIIDELGKIMSIYDGNSSGNKSDSNCDD
jgi:hypothetical protein